MRSVIEKSSAGRWWVLLPVLLAPAAACEIIAGIPDVVDGRDAGGPGGGRCPALDPNAGCGEACQPTPFSKAKAPIGITIHAGTVYWAEENGVMSASTASREEMHSWAAVAPEEVAADESGVYWTHTYDHCIGHGPLDGGAASTLGTCMGTPGGQLALDEGHVYWVVTAEGGGETGSVMRASKDGLNVEIYASDEPSPRAVAVDGKFIYWSNTTSESEGVIKRCLKTGCEGASMTVVEDAGDPTRMAIDGEFLYWLDKWNHEIRRVHTTEPNLPIPIETVATGLYYGSSLVVDDTHVYWSEGEGSILRRRKVPDAVVEVLGGERAHSVAVDCSDVYWTEQATGVDQEGVIRVAR